MGRTSFLITALLLAGIALQAQSNEYLVYAMKGPVTMTTNKKETPLKIGRILNDSVVVNIKKGGFVTLICNGVHVFALGKEGSTPLWKYRDSCVTGAQNLTSNYFLYVWKQMYVRSPDNPNRSLMNNAGSVVRTKPDAAVQVEISELLDSINYAGGSMPLVLDVKNYKGSYLFELFSAASKKKLFSKNTATPTISIADFGKYMKPDSAYYWTVALKGWGTTDPKFINCHPAEQLSTIILNLSSDVYAAEDEATRTFRLAYLLESFHYLADAYKYYETAAKADKDGGVFKERFKEFRKELGVK
jgi:hypothetical protein